MVAMLTVKFKIKNLTFYPHRVYVFSVSVDVCVCVCVCLCVTKNSHYFRALFSRSGYSNENTLCSL
jgi:hypothetical protein